MFVLGRHKSFAQIKKAKRCKTIGSFSFLQKFRNTRQRCDLVHFDTSTALLEGGQTIPQNMIDQENILKFSTIIIILYILEQI